MILILTSWSVYTHVYIFVVVSYKDRKCTDVEKKTIYSLIFCWILLYKIAVQEKEVMLIICLFIN